MYILQDKDFEQSYQTSQGNQENILKLWRAPISDKKHTFDTKVFAHIKTKTG